MNTSHLTKCRTPKANTKEPVLLTIISWFFDIKAKKLKLRKRN